MKLFIKHACDPICVFRSIKVALVIGTIHGLLNHFDEIIEGSLTTTNILQILITYFIPYIVATYGSAMQARHMELLGMKQGEEAGQEAPACEARPGIGPGPDLKTRLRMFHRYARDKDCMVRSLRAALLIGTIIVLLNHFDAMLNGTLSQTNVVQMLVTYSIPFFVATYGAAMQGCHIELAEEREENEARENESKVKFINNKD